MHKIIRCKDQDPLGVMMLDYLSGRRESYLEVESSNLDMSTMTAELMFRDFAGMSPLEQHALSLCSGSILDVGAGSGCHSLYLQEQQKKVTSLDISPGCVKVMKKRGVKEVLHKNLFSITGQKFSTILMLMNGIGICGSLAGLHEFFHFLPNILQQGGQLLTDSTDLAPLYQEAVSECINQEGYLGETEFVMRYNKIESAPFDWLYIDFETLRHYAQGHDFRCELLMREEAGQYLARIF